MKTKNLLLFVFVCCASMSFAQVTFKANNVLAGSTGNSGSSNVSFGYGALKSGASVNLSVAIGVNALSASSSMADYNTAVGSHALFSNTGGYSNTATGCDALRLNQSSLNTANGMGALYRNNYGYWNTAVGAYALDFNTTGFANTAIGGDAGVSSSNGSLNNATAIGYGARANESNSIVLGNLSVQKIIFRGQTIHSSDGRAKKNIRSEVQGLAFINLLQPVTYNYNLDALDELENPEDPKTKARRDSILNAISPEAKAIEEKARADKEKIIYSGFIAQDVEKAAKSVGYDFSGVAVPKDGKGAYGLGYAEFVVPLVKAVQELSEQNNSLLDLIQDLQSEVKALKGSAPDAHLRSATNETETTGMIDAVVAQCKLYQNMPNPFGQNTEIKYYIPENVKSARLCIYNLQGTQIKQIVIAERGEGSQLISGSELTAGMYLYALIVDGKEVDVKRMILTE